MEKENPKPIWGRILPIYPIKIKNKMKTKEEVIKEAWGTLMPDYTNIDLDNGWSKDSFSKFDRDNFDLIFVENLYLIRPKSLQGIENNNGWIKIESEDDLPKDEDIVEFWVYDDEEIVSAKFMYESKRWYHDVNLNLRLFPTHYQPIIKPLKPLY